MAQQHCSILCWNVRGFNDGARRASVRNLIASSGATIVCLQETKIQTWTRSLLYDTLGPGMVDNYAVLPATGTAGGILVAAAERFFHLETLRSTEHTISAKITMLQENTSWCITGVYGRIQRK
jgi:exonuclease III